MKECSNTRFKNMYHAYELGLLTEDDRRDFETHLLECDACYENLKLFEQESALIRHDDDFKRETLKTKGERKVLTTSKYWRFSLAAAAVFIILLFKPWNISIETDDPVYAVENRITVLYFSDESGAADSLKYDEMVLNLLIADLSSSSDITVTSVLQLNDIYKALNKTINEKLDAGNLEKIVKRTGSKWLLEGSIDQVQPFYIISFSLKDASTQKTATTRKINGEPGEKIFSVIDKLSGYLKQSLELPEDAFEGRGIADVTTNSEDAYRYFIEGVDVYNKYYSSEPKNYFKTALEYDSAFAMVYYYLSLTDDNSYIDSAVKYSDNSGFIEKQRILSRKAIIENDRKTAIDELVKIIDRYPNDKEAFYEIGILYYNPGMYDSSIYYFSQAIERDAYYTNAYNMLTYCYSMIDDFENAILTINRYIALVPEEPNPYDTRGELFARYGELDKAIESYTKAVEFKPDFLNSINYLGYLYLYKNEIEKADSMYQSLIRYGDAYWKRSGEFYLNYKYILSGQFQKALANINEIIIDDSQDTVPHASASYHYLQQGLIYRVINQQEQALESFKKAVEEYVALNPDNKFTFRHFVVQMYAEMGKIDEAVKLRDELKKYVESNNNRSAFTYWYSAGYIEFVKGNYDLAADYFYNSMKDIRDQNEEGYFLGHFMLARSHQKNGRLKEAIDIYEDIDKIYSLNRMFRCTVDIKRYYYLGLAYEASNWNEQAIAQYEKFIDYWGDADYSFEEIKDARLRLKRLKSNG